MGVFLFLIGLVAILFAIGYLIYWFYCKFIKKEKKGLKLFVITGIVGIILFFVGGTMLPDTDDQASEPSTHKSKKVNKKVAKSKQKKSSNEQPKIAEKQSKTSSKKPKVSSEDEAALESAEDYANEQNMSKAALYDQLVSKDGEKFPQEAAQYAIDHVKANWNKNALESAKYYRKDQHMSTAEIKDQLTSEDGDQFTQAQAEYAVANLPK